MSISNLFTPNSYNLYSNKLSSNEIVSNILTTITQNVENLTTNNIITETVSANSAIIEKLKSDVNGSSLSVYNPLQTYDMGDIVFYNGCIYNSLIDDNTTTPSQSSPDWSKISNLRSNKTFVVNNLIGDDNKAVEECSNYPFASLDACIDYANTVNPTGNYKIVIQDSTTDYTLSRDLSNLTITSVGGTFDLVANRVSIVLTDEITISGIVSINGVGLFHNNTTSTYNPIKVIGTLSLYDCLFSTLNNTYAMFKLTTSLTPSSTNPQIYITYCFSFGPVNSGKFDIVESDGVLFGTGAIIMLRDCPGNTAVFTFNDLSTSTNKPRIFVSNSATINVVSQNTSVIGLNSVFSFYC